MLYFFPHHTTPHHTTPHHTTPHHTTPHPYCLPKSHYLNPFSHLFSSRYRYRTSPRSLLTLRCLPLLLMLATINLSHAELSAKTVKVIEGSKPYLVLADGTKITFVEQLLGFEMPKQDGSSGTEFIDATKDVVTAPKGMKLSDVKALVVADNQAHTVPIGNLKDDDGDIVSPLGTMTAVWKNNGQVVSDLNQSLLNPCSSYTLTISINHLQARTTYGVPNVSDYGSAAKTYAFIFGVINDETGRTNHKITHIQPQSMDVLTAPDAIYPQGYNPAVWEADKGFSVSKMNAVGKHFPTTGFDKAVFDLVGSGSDQTRYCVKAPANSWVKVSGRQVTYHHDSKQSKPKTPVKLDMYYRDDNNDWSKVDSYTIPVPSKWAISPVGESYQVRYGNAKYLEDVTQFYALDACRKVGPRADNGTTLSKAEADRRGAVVGTGNGMTKLDQDFRQQFLYRRDELTNNKNADRTYYPEGSALSDKWMYGFDGGVYFRDIGTFTSEWGWVSDYAQSPWSADYMYWTAEVRSSKDIFNVNSDGEVNFCYPDSGACWEVIAICRGE